MKMLIYLMILVGVMLFPLGGTDVGRLIPVEVIAVSESDGVVMVAADTGDLGEGNTLAEALNNLKETAPGIIYLDTAEYLLIEEGMDARELAQYLKGNVKVYQAEERVPLEGIADYLSVHQSDIKLKEAADNSQIPTIREENGRYLMIQK